MKKFVEAKFKDVVLGAAVIAGKECSQKLDDPISDTENKHGQSFNCTCRGFHKPDEIVKTTDYSIKSSAQ